MNIKSGYRVYVSAMLRGVFDDDDVEWRVDFHPSMSRKEVDALIDDLNEDVSPVDDDVLWMWVYDNNRSRAMQRHLDIICNESGKLMTPEVWFNPEQKSLNTLEE